MNRIILIFAAVLIIGTVNAQGSSEETATTLTGNETSLATGRYKVNSNITFNQTLILSGDVDIILGDGYVMNVGTKDKSVEGCGIDDKDESHYNLIVSGSGTLNVYASSNGISVKSFTLNGGTVNVNGSYGILASGVANESSVNILGGSLTATGSNGNGITANNGNISISGGIVEANGNLKGISRLSTNGKIILAGGTVTASSYLGTVEVSSGLIYSDGNNTSTVFTNLDKTKTLRPALLDAISNAAAIEALKKHKLGSIVLHDRILYKDGYWNTLCLPFDIANINAMDGENNFLCPLHGASVRTLTNASISGYTLDLTFGEPVTALTAGTPYIIKWTKADGYDQASEDTRDIKNPVFYNVTISDATNNATFSGVLTFTGTYSPVSINSNGDNTKLYLGAGNKLYWPNGEMTVKCQRAYFQLADGITAGEKASVRAFNLNFGDEDDKTGITTTDFLDEPSGRAERTDYTDKASAWYDLSGRNLSGKPTKKGLYINNGKLVVIK